MRKLLAALALAAGVGPAQALTVSEYVLGDLSNLPYAVLAQVPVGDFLDDYTFQVDAPGTAVGSAQPVPLDLPVLPDVEYYAVIGFVAIQDAAGNTLAFDADGSDGYLTAAALPAAGTYEFVVSGVALGVLGGLYLGAVATDIPALPEPGSGALMLAGLGIAGSAARRRGKAGRHGGAAA